MVKTVEVVRNKPIKQMQVEVENGKKLHEEKKKFEDSKNSPDGEESLQNHRSSK
jgi:hypothetical protein